MIRLFAQLVGLTVTLMVYTAVAAGAAAIIVLAWRYI